MINQPGSNPTGSAEQRASRLREAFASMGAFFSAAREPDPLPTLRDLASDWLHADQLEIVVPAGTGALASDRPDTLCGPVVIGRRVIGRIEARRSQPFGEDDRAMLGALGRLIGAIFDQSALQSQVDQYASQARANADTLDELLSFSRLVVSATADPRRLALQLATQIPAMVGGERASLLLIPPDDPASPVLVLSNGSISDVERAREVRDHGLAGLVLSERAPLIIDETDTDRRWLALPLSRNDTRTRCAMAAPLMWGEQLLGAITVTTTQSRLFNTPQLNLLELVACHISLAIHTANLERRLSGLANTIATATVRLDTALHSARAAAAAGDSAALAAALDLAGAAAGEIGRAEVALRLAASPALA